MLQSKILAAAVALVWCSPVFADSTHFSSFTAIPSSVAAGSLPESAPFWLSSPAFTQKVIASVKNQVALGEANPGQWDQITSNETGANAGRYLFVPFEKFDTNNPQGGVQRTDLSTGLTKTIVLPGTQGFVAGDASRWTPWGSYLTAEESWDAKGSATGYKGRLFEVTNSLADANKINFVQRNILPRTSHEGLVFDKNNSLYFIDEFDGGSIYKYISANPNAISGDAFFDKGQAFAMKVADGFNSNAVGAVTWEAITAAAGTPLASTITSVLNVGNGQFAVDGRMAADLVGATNYNRPEEIEIKTMNGQEVIFIVTTGSHEVYSLNLASNEMRIFVSRGTINSATGLPVGTELTSPDNVEIDADGNVYIVEDQPGGEADIWFATDANNDGVAESIGRWATMSTVGAEPTGLYFDKFNPNVAYVNVMHPDSGNDTMVQITASRFQKQKPTP